MAKIIQNSIDGVRGKMIVQTEFKGRKQMQVVEAMKNGYGFVIVAYTPMGTEKELKRFNNPHFKDGYGYNEESDKWAESLINWITKKWYNIEAVN